MSRGNLRHQKSTIAQCPESQLETAKASNIKHCASWRLTCGIVHGALMMVRASSSSSIFIMINHLVGVCDGMGKAGLAVLTQVTILTVHTQ